MFELLPLSVLGGEGRGEEDLERWREGLSWGGEGGIELGRGRRRGVKEE